MYNNSSSNSQSSGRYLPSQQQLQQQQQQQLANIPNSGLWNLQNAAGGGGDILANVEQLREPANLQQNPLEVLTTMSNRPQRCIGGGALKRSLRESNGEGKETAAAEHNKENHQPNAKRFHQHLPSGDESNKAAEGNGSEDEEEEEEEEDDEEEEEEEERVRKEGESRSTKSSSENEDTGNFSAVLHQPQPKQHPANLMLTPLNRNQQQLTAPYNIMGNPLAQSTPYLGGLSLNSFQQPLDYWGGMALQQMSSQLALVAANNKGGTAGGNSASLGQQLPNSAPSGYYSNPYMQQQQQQQHNLLANYGATPAAASGASAGSFSIPTQGYSFLQQPNTTSFNSTYQSRDSGVGSVKVEIKEDGKNESGSSTSGGSDESANSAFGRELAVLETKFPPYLHSVVIDGRPIVRDLETIHFGMVPPRLALLNCNKKYPITLAEICRRLGWPEHLNTSYLSGILRKAKTHNAGRELRDRLNSYGCGFDLKTGRRKQASVTTFTTLCEREAIQMADDFTKLATESFPHRQLAVEMNRKAVKSTEQIRRKRLIDVQNTSQILREAILILQQGIEQETQPFIPPSQAALMEATTDQSTVLPTTLEGIKNFARLSHCFGNRTVMVAWQTLLNVFQKCEQSLDETLHNAAPEGGMPGSSNQQMQYDPHQMLLQKIREQQQQRN